MPKGKTQKKGQHKLKSLHEDPNQSIKSIMAWDPPSIYNLIHVGGGGSFMGFFPQRRRFIYDDLLPLIMIWISMVTNKDMEISQKLDFILDATKKTEG